MSVTENHRQIYDDIEGLPDPSANLVLFGHQSVEDELAAAYRSGRMHHAWLISGNRGIGKATLAYRFANHIFHHPDPAKAPRQLYAPSPDGRDHHQLAAGSHPNLLHLTRPWDQRAKAFKSTLSVDEIRRTQAFFGLTAAGGGWRIAIVDPAEDMNISAANALLKTLEEPPQKSLLLLVCNAPGKLLPTIRSRCRKISLKPLDTSDLAMALGSLYGSTDRFEKEMNLICALAEGSVRKAIQLIEGGGLKNYRSFLSLLDNPASQPTNWPAIHNFAEKLSTKAASETYLMFLDQLSGFLARRVRGQDEPVRLNNWTYNTVPLARWAEIWEKIENSSSLADTYNLDKKQVVLTIFRCIIEAKI